MSGELLFSSIGVGATKLKPLKSWWAFALGGIPGESEYAKIIQKIDRLTYRHPLNFAEKLEKHTCACRFTFRRFSSELWVEAEGIIWFTCCRLEWRLELSPVQFLEKGNAGTHTCRKYTRKLEINPTARCLESVNICAREAKTPPRLTPSNPTNSSVQPTASCWLLNTHAGLLAHTQ